MMRYLRSIKCYLLVPGWLGEEDGVELWLWLDDPLVGVVQHLLQHVPVVHHPVLQHHLNLWQPAIHGELKRESTVADKNRSRTNMGGGGGVCLVSADGSKTFLRYNKCSSMQNCFLHALVILLLLQTFYFVLHKKIQYETYDKYNLTICRLLVGPLCKAGVARIEIRAVTISPAKLTNWWGSLVSHSTL